MAASAPAKPSESSVLDKVVGIAVMILQHIATTDKELWETIKTVAGISAGAAGGAALGVTTGALFAAASSLPPLWPMLVAGAFLAACGGKVAHDKIVQQLAARLRTRLRSDVSAEYEKLRDMSDDELRDWVAAHLVDGLRK